MYVVWYLCLIFLSLYRRWMSEIILISMSEMSLERILVEVLENHRDMSILNCGGEGECGFIL